MRILFFIPILILTNAYPEYFDESLKIERKTKTDVFVDFRFNSERNYIKNDADFVSFPRVIQELIDEYKIVRLIITMGLGRWSIEKYGLPPQPSSQSGVQVYVEFQTMNRELVDEKFKFLLDALNGVLCTSISHISISTRPVYPIFANIKTNSTYRRYGILSGENTCTENLTRLSKLLPCKNTGLSTLLHPSKLYDVLYHASSLKIENSCDPENGKENCRSSAEVGIAVVMKLKSKNKQHVSLMSLFDRKLSSKCEMSRKSIINLKSGNLPEKYIDLKSADISSTNPLDIELASNDERIADKSIRSWTSQGGIDQRNGILSIFIENPGPIETVQLSQVFPVYVKMRYSKINTICLDLKRNAVEPKFNGKLISVNMRISHTPTLLQYDLTVGSGVTCEIRIPFEKDLLRLDQYSPDANHGIHIPAAVLLLSNNHTIHSNPVLAILPVPDFSMPFNVICFVGTAFSLIYGPIQLYSTMWLAPSVENTKMTRKIYRGVLLIFIAFCLYAHFIEISLNEIRRMIEKHWEKLNEMR